MRAFTLVEIMVVVVIIGLLAAAGIPAFRRVTLRSKVTALENDLRQFSSAIQASTLQNGRWPADGDPQVIPTELANVLPANFIYRTPIGGVYKWNFSSNPTGAAEGVDAKAAIMVVSVTGNRINDDVELLTMLDKQMDDGNLQTGNIQTSSANSLVYVIEK